MNFSKLSRRNALCSSACGFGGLALAGLATRQALVAQTHFAPRAKRVIFLFMHGGVSQMDSFDRKPVLNEQHGNPLPFDLPGLIRPDRLGKVFGVKWNWAQHGECGQWVSELFPHTARIVDKLCFIKSLHTEGEAHGQAVLRLHTGEAAFVRPCVGSWVSYGLGSENEDLPAFVALDYPTMHGGVRLYGSSFLPAKHQAMPIRLASTPNKTPEIANLRSEMLTARRQREQVDVITELSRLHVQDAGGDPQLEGVIESYELAYRMQSIAPEVLDVEAETAETQSMYGISQSPTDAFGRQCLLARRMVEAGVRYVQVATGYHWITMATLKRTCPRVPHKPTNLSPADRRPRSTWAAQRNLSGVGGRVWTDARCPDRSRRAGPRPQSPWLYHLDGGRRSQTRIQPRRDDEFGYLAVEKKVHMHDLHATILHLLGLDHQRLTYRYAGRDFRLTDVYGRVVKDLLA